MPPSPGLEPRFPCAPVFVNEPFKVYPPCPSFAIAQPIDTHILTTGIAVFFVLLGLLFLILVISLLVGSMD